MENDLKQNQNQRKPRKKQILHSSLLEYGKVPPQEVEMEEAVLGAVLLDKSCFSKVYKVIDKPDVFYKEAHQLIWDAILKVVRNKDPIDILTVVHQARISNTLKNIGGPYYIAQLTKRVGSSSNVEVHARVVYQEFLKRELIRLGSELVHNAFEVSSDVFEIMEQHEKDMKSLGGFVEESKVIRNNDIVTLMISDLQLFIKDPDSAPSTTFPIGLPKFDKYITLGSDRILLIGGPGGHGKSRFARFIMFKLFAAYGDQIAINWITLEDPAVEIVRGYISNKLKIKTKDIESRNYNRGLNETMMSLYDEYRKFDIEFIEQQMKINRIVNNFKSFARMRPGKLNILLIDNILSLGDTLDYKGNQNEFGDYVMSQLLTCRQETHGLIIPIHHFNDDQQKKDALVNAYRPALTHLKGTEAFRRTPNQVLLINNPGLYPDLMAEYPPNIQDVIKHIFLVDPGKNRHDEKADDPVLRYMFTLNFDVFEEL